MTLNNLGRSVNASTTAITLLTVICAGTGIANGQARTTAPPQPGQLRDTISAKPLTTGEKFNTRVVHTFGLRGLVGSAFGAAIGQWSNTPSEWGQGFSGYADRYGSGLAGTLSRQTFAFAMESAFHEDPRYFPSTDKSKKQRILNVVKQTFFCKTDDGGDSFAYGRVISAFGAGQFVNIWQPPSNDSFGNGIERGFITLGVDAGFNFAQEFLPFMRPPSMRHKH